MLEILLFCVFGWVRRVNKNDSTSSRSFPDNKTVNSTCLGGNSNYLSSRYSNGIKLEDLRRRFSCSLLHRKSKIFLDFEFVKFSQSGKLIVRFCNKIFDESSHFSMNAEEVEDNILA